MAPDVHPTPSHHQLRGWSQLVMRLYSGLKWLGSNEQDSFGLDNSSFAVENAPRQMPNRPELQLTRE